MIEFLQHYGPLAMAVLVAIIGLRLITYHVGFLNEIPARRVLDAEHMADLFWPGSEKPKRKRMSPEQWLSEALEDIAEAEQRPHALIGGEIVVDADTPSDVAQMRDLAWQEYLRLCLERNLRARANERPVPIIQTDSDVDEFHDAWRDYSASLDALQKGRRP